MGKKAGDKTLRRRDEIINAARKIMIEEGHHEIGLRNVARRLSISLGAIQHYFGTADELLECTIESIFKTEIGKIGALATNQGLPEDRLDHVLRYLLNIGLDAEMSVITSELGHLAIRNARIAQTVNQTNERLRMMIAMIAGELRPDLTFNLLLVRATLLMTQTLGITIFSRPSGAGVVDEAILREQYLKRAHRDLVADA